MSDKVPFVMRAGFFACGVLTAVVAGGSQSLAQQPAYLLGVLSPSEGTFQRIRETTLPELAKLGFVEGGNLTIETRFGPTEQLPALARELVAVRPQVVLATGTSAIRAIRATGSTHHVISGNAAGSTVPPSSRCSRRQIRRQLW